MANLELYGTRPASRSSTGLQRFLRLALCFVCVASLAGVGVLSPAGASPVQAAAGGGAAAWSLQDAGTTQDLWTVHFIDENTGWACGANGTLLKTTDGGETWVVQDLGTTTPLTAVQFVDANTGWLVGDDGLILRTTNGGDTWVPQVSGTTKNLWDVHFVDANNGWIVGIPGGYGPPPPGEYSPILRTENGGTTWTSVDNDTWFQQSVFFIDVNNGWAAGNGTLIRSTDGGKNWEDIRPDFLSDTQLYWNTHFVDVNTGWAVGASGVILHTEDGGDSWELQDSGRLTELINVHFADENNGWVVGNSGTILSTTDGGATWNVDQAGGSRYVRDVFFTDANTGWAVGQAGMTLAYRYPVGPVTPVEGVNRYVTAVETSRRAFPTGADTAVIATGANWPDALGGTSLAGALGGPVLLVGTNVVPEAVAEEIERLGVADVIILGGTGAVSAGVEAELKTLLGDDAVERVFGDDRYQTAEAVALRVIDALGEDYDGMAFVATGGNFPDALAAAPLAAAQGWPLFLAHPTSGISAGTKAAMADVTDAVILGGTGVVSSATEAQLDADLTGEVTRLAGDDRYATAVAVADYAVDNAGHGWNGVGITTGANFPDALAGGVLQGKMNSVMLLTRPTSLNAVTAGALGANKAAIDTVTYFGGTGAVTQTVRDQVTAVLQD